MGFPSPAKDYEVKDIDLPNYLVPHPLATYFVRVTDNGMDRFHIPQNALLVIDRTFKPTHNKIVVVDVNGERKIRKLIKAPRAWVLEAGSGQPLIITKDMTVQFFGVVTKIIIEP
jgi:DNA polymerase V